MAFPRPSEVNWSWTHRRNHISKASRLRVGQVFGGISVTALPTLGTSLSLRLQSIMRTRSSRHMGLRIPLIARKDLPPPVPAIIEWWGLFSGSQLLLTNG